MTPEPARPKAELIRPQDVLQRILDANADEAWTLLRETIVPARQTMLPVHSRHR